MGRFPVERDVRRRFWQLVRAGRVRGEAATEVGLNQATGTLWFRQSGGVAPSYVRTTSSSRRHLSLAEREEIFAGVERGESIRQIARRLECAPSTILRELRRNMRRQYRTRSRQDGGPGRPRTRPWDYRPSSAQRRAEVRSARPKPAKLARNRQLRAHVQAKLEERLSPEQIAVELRQEYPDDPEMRVSHEAIYQSIYVQGRGITSSAVRDERPTGTGSPCRSAASANVPWESRESARPTRALDVFAEGLTRPGPSGPCYFRLPSRPHRSRH